MSQIYVDTREQKPLTFFGKLTKRIKLDVGDYTTTNLWNKSHIERKSPGDLYGSIIQGHNRFRAEIKRAKKDGIHLAVFVECTEDLFFNKKWPGAHHLHQKSTTLKKIVGTIQRRYDLEIIWCDGRINMENKMIEWFNKEWQKYKKLSDSLAQR